MADISPCCRGRDFGLGRLLRTALAFGFLTLSSAACARTAPLPPAAPTRDVILSVVTWNMKAGAGDLSALIRDLESGRLTGMPPTGFVLLLQESTAEIAAGAAASRPAPLSVHFVPVRRFPDRTFGNAIVSSAPLSAARVVDLPRERQPRAAAVASITVRGHSLFVASVHLENRLGWLRGLFGDAARRRQAAALLASLPAGPGIVGGDMNTMLGPSEPALHLLMQRFDDTPREPLEPTFRDRLVLDHLFFDLPEGWQATRRVLPEAYGSDHRPVLGVITEARTARIAF